MRTIVKTGLSVVLLVLLTACGGALEITPKRLPVTNHWAGNTGGRGNAIWNGDAVSNYLEEMTVLRGDFLFHLGTEAYLRAPLVVTKSGYDETSFEGGAYHNGARNGKNLYHYEGQDNSHTTTFNGLTATIQNLYGRAFNGKMTAPPVYPATGAPYVLLSDGRKITSIVDPTAVGFDNSGKLWIGDNGPDQNFKIFTIPAAPGVPVQTDTFGEQGGVFAGPIPGKTGDLRFWGPRGIGFDEYDNIYIGNTGMPQLNQGGTDVRAFDKFRKPLWNVRGIFTHAPDIDRSSNGTRIYTAVQGFDMDYSKAPGSSWTPAAVTADPFRFPDDARLQMSNESSFVRTIGGKKFLYTTDMYGLYVIVSRFESNSEIAIPAALIFVLDNGQGYGTWSHDLHPKWDASLDANKNRRYMWRDQNGNGKVEAGEFIEFEVADPYSRAVDVDEAGNVWIGGTLAPHSTEFRGGGNALIAFGSVDAYGVPFKGTTPRIVDIPTELFARENPLQVPYAQRLRYLAATDTLVVTTGGYFGKQLYVVDGYLNSGHPTVRFQKDLGFYAAGVAENAIHLDQGTAPMVLPTGIAVDGNTENDYFYVNYLDNGPDAKVRGEITVYSMRDGRKVGWIIPGDETNHFSGATDLLVSMQVSKRSDGTRVITMEENGGAKFMVYHWKP